MDGCRRLTCNSEYSKRETAFRRGKLVATLKGSTRYVLLVVYRASARSVNRKCPDRDGGNCEELIWLGSGCLATKPMVVAQVIGLVRTRT